MSKQSETITLIPIEKLIPFRDHPFQIRDDEQIGVLESDSPHEQGYEVFSEELHTYEDGGNNLQTT